MTLAVLAILFGLGAAWAAKQVLLAKREQPVVQQAAPREAMASLAVLQRNMPADARLLDIDVEQVQQSAAKLKQGNVPLDKVFQYKRQALGRVLKKAKPAGSWLTEDDFYPLGKGPPLKLKEGFRAVTVRIDDPAISSSIIRAGSLVDVIFTTENPDDFSKMTVRLASGVEVLSPPVTEGGLSNSVTSVAKKNYIVLAATPKQANDLAEAQQMDGTISVSLCAAPDSGDGSRLDKKRFDAIFSVGDYRVDERTLLNLPPRPGPPAQPERIVVEQIRGDKINYVVFTGDNERVSQEEARLHTLPAAGGKTAAANPPDKKCKACEEAARKAARERAKRQGGGLSPVPGPSPNPTPAPRGLPEVAPPESGPAPSRST